MTQDGFAGDVRRQAGWLPASQDALVRTVDAQRGHTGLQCLDYQGNIVAW
jgi:hypothetical protein